MWIPENRDFEIQDFLSRLCFLAQHPCIDNPDSECVSGQSIPIEKHIGILLYNHIFLSGLKNFMASSLHRPLVLNTIGEL